MRRDSIPARYNEVHFPDEICAEVLPRYRPGAAPGMSRGERNGPPLVAGVVALAGTPSAPCSLRHASGAPTLRSGSPSAELSPSRDALPRRRRCFSSQARQNGGTLLLVRPRYIAGITSSDDSHLLVLSVSPCPTACSARRLAARGRTFGWFILTPSPSPRYLS